jgi:hypothetical protein
VEDDEDRRGGKSDLSSSFSSQPAIGKPLIQASKGMLQYVYEYTVLRVVLPVHIMYTLYIIREFSEQCTGQPSKRREGRQVHIEY